MKIDAFKEQVEKHPFFSFIVLAGAIIAFFANILSNIITIISFVQKNTFTSLVLFIVVMIVSLVIVLSASRFQKQTILHKVEKLTTGVDIGLYENSLGTATSKTQDV